MKRYTEKLAKATSDVNTAKRQHGRASLKGIEYSQAAMVIIVPTFFISLGIIYWLTKLGIIMTAGSAILYGVVSGLRHRALSQTLEAKNDFIMGIKQQNKFESGLNILKEFQALIDGIDKVIKEMATQVKNAHEEAMATQVKTLMKKQASKRIQSYKIKL